MVLAGHGVPATDCPPELVGEMMGLEWRSQGTCAPELQRRIGALDEKIRNWPRRPGNDPYLEGLERLAGVLRPMLPEEIRLEIGYNEFCAPSVFEAVARVVSEGARRVLVIPTMLTPGGVHSEKDIPRTLEAARRAHPGVRIDYVWPFDLKEVAGLLSAHVKKALQAG